MKSFIKITSSGESAPWNVNEDKKHLFESNIFKDVFLVFQLLFPNASCNFCWSRLRSWRQQLKQRGPDLLLLSHLLQLFWENTKVCPDQPGDVVSPVCPGSASWSFPGGTSLKHLLESPPYCGGGVCLPEWSQELCCSGRLSLVGPLKANWSWVHVRLSVIPLTCVVRC